MTTILITGGTGGTGRPLAALLAEAGAQVRTASRHRPDSSSAEHALLDWDDPGTYAEALKGVDRLYLLPPTFAPDFHALLTPFLAAASAAGVQRIVLLGAAQAPPAQAAIRTKLQEAIARAVPEWAVLRPTWFMQNFINGHPYYAGLHERGEIVTATGSGRIGFIDVRDIAAVAAHLLTAETAGETDYLLTGPQKRMTTTRSRK
ncbi:NAD(P)H-binding protein [Fodinicola feengrottensis]|uniref:NAD(P)H-binding protein n=1 Tax=Fodinicola feengrottensis TaxID=435914 RepID=UPI0013D4BD77|nr:NAD(P)H-binding protein [Fodinicola feengrottensis]